RIGEQYHHHNANRLTVEVNYGGEWVTSAFHQEDPSINVYKIHAKKGKRLRAQPVAQAYRQGRVVHVGDLSLLEKEMLGWDSLDPKADSPNRVDAMAYGVIDLLDLVETAVPQQTYWSIRSE